MRQITILSIDEDSSQFYKQQIHSIFKDIAVDYRNLEMEPIPPIYHTDLILYTDPEIINLLIGKIRCDVPQLMMKRTISRTALKEINRIEPDSDVLVVNINEFMANETMALIYQLGKTDIFMEPYFPGKVLSKEEYTYVIHIAPDIFEFAEDIRGRTIVTGHRLLDISNVLDIIYILNIEEKTAQSIIWEMMNRVPTCWYGINYSMKSKFVSEVQLDYVLDDFDSGVLILDKNFDINTCNNAFCKLTGVSKKKLLHRNFYEAFRLEERFMSLVEKDRIHEELVSVNRTDCFVSVRTIRHQEDDYGKMVLLKPYFDVVELFNKSNKAVKSGYFSKYCFESILGDSKMIRSTKRMALKFSLTDEPVLILGDTGTGKELFAGAIHNASLRRKEPFIAVNCSTLSKTLLESELFGYEEGAFTGARKGGKIGLLERASGGTIFLDEIGDLPMELQPRLLRALEEQSIMRVGGDKLIRINTRILAATNRDILQMVKESKFRRDLLYRLNVFELHLPSLEERVEDIPVILRYWMDDRHIERKFCKGFRIFCENYSWDGNIRELKNMFSYIEVMTEREVGFHSLPQYLHKREYFEEEQLKYLVLALMCALEEAGIPSGRRTLEKVFSEVYFKISEVEIRSILNELKDARLIVIKNGRSGSEVTGLGRELLLKEEFFFEIEENELITKVKETVGKEL
ncbi:MAG: sigma 54-interacting transcriptional regulator [Filifactor alocis]|nr:sigma 54-interacting transcriptional regulator [Filifactor alocis]